jgi:hypothetical protein
LVDAEVVEGKGVGVGVEVVRVSVRLVGEWVRSVGCRSMDHCCDKLAVFNEFEVEGAGTSIGVKES